MATKDIAVKDEAALPALAPTPALAAFGADNISLPRLYKGEAMGNAFKDGLVEKGSIYVASGADDPNPEVIWHQGDEEGVLVHFVDAFLRKSKKTANGFETWAPEDPAAPADADLDYHFVAVLPEVDPEIPVKVTLAKTSVPTAKRIIFQLKRGESHGVPMHAQAFRLSATYRERTADGTKQQWYVWTEKKVEAEQANIEAAVQAQQLAAGPQNNDIETTAPASQGPAI